MFYTCSLDLAADCSPNDFLGIPACVLSKLSPIQSACCSSDSVMACFPSSRSPMTFGASTVDLGRESLIAWLEDSRAKESLSPEKEAGSMIQDQDYGPTKPGSLARWNQSSSSWRTRQRSLAGGLIEFSETFPKWGSMRNGELFRQKMPSGLVDLRQWITCVKESGSSVTTLPTPNKTEGDGGPQNPDKRKDGGHQVRLRDAISVGTPTTANTGRSDRFKKGRRRTPQEIAESMSAPTPSASDASRGGVLTDNMTGVSLVQYVNTLPTPTVNGNYNRKGSSPKAGDGLATAVTRVPTPHGFSKDGKSNGPSGNELGHAVNKMRVPTPRSADGVHVGVTATCTTKRRAANGQANLGEFVLATSAATSLTESHSESTDAPTATEMGCQTIPTPAAQDAKNSTLPVSQTDRDSVPGYMLRTGQEGSLNPDWVEWLMGWPIGWTSFEPLPADAFDEWLILAQMRAWHHVEPPIPRTAKDIPNRVARLKAIGNGQVPLAAWLAWTILYARLLGDSIPVAVDKAIPGPDHL